jgi:predicted TIM-barrel fold metal-dependent hydrolase
MIIDFHAHIYKEEIADKVISSIENFYGVKRRHDATLASLLGSMKDGAFDKAVILPISTKPEHEKLNAWYAGLAEISDKIIPFGGVHPDNDVSILDSFPKLGLKGFKLQPNAQKVHPADPRLLPFYEKARDMGLIVVFHAGDEESGFRGEFTQPEDFVPILKSFPGMITVLSHLGGYRTWDRLDLVLGYDDVWYDTAHIPGNLPDEEIKILIDRIGVDKVLFGSDFPFSDHAQDRRLIEGILGDAAIEVLSNNPRRLLGL